MTSLKIVQYYEGYQIVLDDVSVSKTKFINDMHVAYYCGFDEMYKYDNFLKQFGATLVGPSGFDWNAFKTTKEAKVAMDQIIAFATMARLTQ